MFVIKRTRMTVNRKGTHCFLVGYWNANLQRFAAEPFASTFPANEAENICKNLNRILNKNIYDPSPSKISVQPVNPEVKAVTAPADAPQFERD